MAGFRKCRGLECGSSGHARAGVEAGRSGPRPVGGRGGHDLRAGRLGRPGPFAGSDHGGRRRFSGKGEASSVSSPRDYRCTRTCGWQWYPARTSPGFWRIRPTRCFARSMRAPCGICWIPLRWREKARAPLRPKDGSQFVLPERATIRAIRYRLPEFVDFADPLWFRKPAPYAHYVVEGSADGKSLVASGRPAHGPWRGLQTDRFAPAPLSRVRLRGTFSNGQPFRVEDVRFFRVK